MKIAPSGTRGYLAVTAASHGEDGLYAAPCRTPSILPGASNRQQVTDGSDKSFLLTVSAVAAVEIALMVAWLIRL
jgi:hypothetical protein